ncbi:PREDICTED: uncharacterized protein LOC104772406 [Camelina sativa]|uniref:Uncharacterized protein LOC104772406 n=1 Tax=Camelina sativa TaxID=90675 RepID=A0ABM0Y4H7_CAMSA|nr:PREDICTED: uncharacterized protein LOC104772406 [Camelina sativa]
MEEAEEIGVGEGQTVEVTGGEVNTDQDMGEVSEEELGNEGVEGAQTASVKVNVSDKGRKGKAVVLRGVCAKKRNAALLLSPRTRPPQGSVMGTGEQASKAQEGVKGGPEFPYLGDCLSWRGWRDKKPIRCRLDRALGNEDWHDLFPDTITEYLPRVASDHMPLLGCIGAKRPRGRRNFMFDRRWVGKEGLMEAISSGWGAPPVRGSPSFVNKVVSCRRAISCWRKEQAPYGRVLIEDIKKELEAAHADDTTSPKVIAELTGRLREAYKDEEMHWYLKSRNRWMRVGDKNTKYFHAQTKQRRARNRIVGLYDKHDVWSTDDVTVKETAVSYFGDLFSTINPSSFDEVLLEVKSVITAVDNERLTAPATEAEVRKALFMMHPDKAPGPDGMTALFFQKAWEVVKTDLVSLVNSFFEENAFESGLNQTHICLIPKVTKPTRMAELRPISLCNVGYKVLSKVLCNRLKTILPRLISETQSAFVPGRLISDNILIAQEMFHGLRTNNSCKGKFMAIKTDMSKAYDRVEWGFLGALFRRMGFAEKWISWIMLCVSSVQYQVLVNGQPHGQIIPERGLRQGDPLSPYLFILCTEVLIANIRKAEVDKRITGIKVANKCPPITHLLFADDSLFFFKVYKDQCGVVLDILKQYEAASGQQINFAKSSLQFGHTVDDPARLEMQGILGISNLGGMGSYLGIPESLGGSKTKVVSFVRDRLQSRTTGWTARLLSKGGKEVMVKSVATAVPSFVMSCYRLPKTITSKLTSAVANFWWSTSGQRGLWRLIEFPDSLFARVFKSRYYRNSNPMEPLRFYSPSYGWRSIVSARSLVNIGLIKRVGSGDTIDIWSDPWIPAQSPRPALQNGSPVDPNLSLSHFIDPSTRTWRRDRLIEHFDSVDVPLIQAIPLSSYPKGDSLGWHFTKSGRYSVKSGYDTVRLGVPSFFKAFGSGPDITTLLAGVWQVRCPPKLKHFMWQALTGCISVSANLRRRGVACDVGCSRCGAEEETVNHVLFLCPPARQAWAQAHVPVGPQHFPTESVYANVDHFIGRNNPGSQVDFFPWLMWYIWKARNAKVFENRTEHPDEVVRLAEGEAASWFLAQTEEGDFVGPSPPSFSARTPRGCPNSLSSVFSGYRCFVDGSWK